MRLLVPAVCCADPRPNRGCAAGDGFHVRLGLALLALAPATVLMGATLPILTRHLTRDAHLSLAFGRLYAANTIGAILGTLAAGLVLIELLGLTGALVVGATCSGIAGLLAVFLARRQADVPFGFDRLASSRQSPRCGFSNRARLALLIAFISGMTSLGYQVTWTRLLAAGPACRRKSCNQVQPVKGVARTKDDLQIARAEGRRPERPWPEVGPALDAGGVTVGTWAEP